ncbi:hypothetical protein LEP1GSC013_0323 [Leptospira interrogans serovar Valbuzzi str. Duyster]|nr:hypothetical protein LEP1GSC013_0323 [Leptospira interrogans serovar Valbuzzi str. Duyster]ENO72465.1 hypothetical protein LEP1GSC012_3885 [Leptospira interrogans serovar Valbuzzi str. Valbuzzi]
MKKLVLMISLLLQCQWSGAWIDEVEMNHETGLCKWEPIFFWQIVHREQMELLIPLQL